MVSGSRGNLPVGGQLLRYNGRATGAVGEILIWNRVLVLLVLLAPASSVHGGQSGQPGEIVSPQMRTRVLLDVHKRCIGSEAKPALDLARSDDPAVRYWFAKAVRYMSAPDQELLQACRGLLKDADLVVRVTAAAALVAKGQQDEGVVEAFRAALSHRQPGIRLEALTYLYELPEFLPRVRAHVQAVLDEGDANPYEVRTLAQKVLALDGSRRGGGQ